MTTLEGSQGVLSEKQMPMKLRWGIAGLGRIAHEFAVAIVVSGMPITAVAAGALPHRKRRSKFFGSQFNLPPNCTYDNYLDLAKDPNVDIVYVATTNQLHRNVSMLMMKYGKHVLVEKPTAMNFGEAKEMVEYAKKQKVFFATNFWNAAFPAVRFARQAVRTGQIGDIVEITGDMGFQVVPNHNDRWLSAKLGGGSIMDMACYLFQFLVMFGDEKLEEPYAKFRKSSEVSGGISRDIGNYMESDEKYLGLNDVSILAVVGKNDPTTGVDVDADFLLEYKGIKGRFGSSLSRASPFTVDILGSQGAISIGSPANCPTTATLTAFQDARRTTFLPFPCCQQPLVAQRVFSEGLPVYPRQFYPQQYPRGTGFAYIIRAVAECLMDEGCLELPDVPHKTTLRVQAVVDQTRKRLNSSFG